jgi:hypothetical protein
VGFRGIRIRCPSFWALLLAFILIRVPCASVIVKPQIGSFSSSFLSVSDYVFAKSSLFSHRVGSGVPVSR